MILLAAALVLAWGCGGGNDRILRAYDAKNNKLVVLTGSMTKPARFIENADFVVVGGGIGGIAAAITLSGSGRVVVLIEESDHIAGCLTPGDTLSLSYNAFVENYGTSKAYRLFRDKLREWYAKKSETPPSTIPGIEPGAFCFTTEAALDVIRDMLAQYESQGKLTVLLRTKVAKVTMFDRRVASVTAIDLDKNEAVMVSGWAFVDASIQGDVLTRAGALTIAGAESRVATGEPHAPDTADSLVSMNVLAVSDPAVFGKNVKDGIAVLNTAVTTGNPPQGKAYVFPVMMEARRLTESPVIVSERDISAESNPGPRAKFFTDSVGVGFHPMSVRGSDGSLTVIPTKPFQIPLGALAPKNLDNLFAGGLNIGMTRVASTAFTNSQTEWAIGEAAGMAASFCGGLKQSIHAVLGDPSNVRQIQNLMVKRLGAPIYWYDNVKSGDPGFDEAQLRPFENPGYDAAAKSLSFQK